MYRLTLPACVFLLVGVLPAGAITMARNGAATVDIAMSPQATLAEQTAAAELAHYLQAITGGAFAIIQQGAPSKMKAHIFVGQTRPAARLGLTPEKLGPEEWVIRPSGKDLIIVGGRPRGTLYGVYHFLEDVLRVHWWSPWEESVPQAKTLAVDVRELRGKPVLPYRDIYMLYGNDGGRFAARNRLNRDGDARIKAEYGGCRDYGPPYHVHTFNTYFPPQKYAAEHPEWYSLVGGKRLLADPGQLCLTNQEMRQAFLAKLVGFIEQTSAEAEAAGAPPPDVFSVSQNDWDYHCECDNCQAIATAEESEAGPLLDFVNFLADSIKDKYPWVYIDTLAYQYTQQAPKSVRPRDNVIVRLCDTESDPMKPITAPENAAFREHLLSWARIAKNLRVWDYAVTYANPNGMPLPTMHTYDDDYQFYKEHSVEGVFTEHEYVITSDLRDLKVWMMIKLLENPYADYDKLVKTFTDGFYGPAGKHIRDYVAALEAEAIARKSTANWSVTPMSLTYLNLDFTLRAQRIFDAAMQAAGDNEVLARRVRHARLPLDRATVVTYTRLNSEWQTLGRPEDMTPPTREAAAERAMNTWMEQADLRIPADGRDAERAAAEKEMRRYTALPSAIALPEKFRDLPRGTVYDYTADMTRNWSDVVKVVKDPEAESGIANKLDLASESTPEREKYVLPMPWGLYGAQQKEFVPGSVPIKAEDIPGPGYHWYKMGTFKLAPSYYAYFFWSWIIQADIDNAYDAGNPDQQFDIWARIRFTGPRFPHAQEGEPDAIYVERLVLVKAQ